MNRDQDFITIYRAVLEAGVSCSWKTLIVVRLMDSCYRQVGAPSIASALYTIEVIETMDGLI